MNRDMMTKSKRKRRVSTASSSSEQTETLKEPKDVLELGKYLVRELGFDDGVDTLGRWMSHHVAELITLAKSERTVSRQRSAQRDAVSTILKIWEHRRDLPSRANPIGPYADLLKFLELVRNDSSSSPFGYFRGRAESHCDELSARLFKAFTRLIGVLLFMKVGQLGSRSSTRERVVLQALSPDERRLLDTIRSWERLVGAGNSRNGRSGKRSASEPPKPLNLPELAMEWLDEIHEVVPDLRKAIEDTLRSTHPSDDANEN